MSDSLDDALGKATVIVKESIDPPQGFIEDQKPLADELVMTFFQVRGDKLNKEELQKLDEISKYVNDTAKSEDTLDRLQVLRDIRFRLGAPELGKNRYDQFYQYIRLKQAAKKYATEAEAMEE